MAPAFDTSIQRFSAQARPKCARALLLLLVLVPTWVAWGAEGRPKADGPVVKPRTDLYGDPLPDGALLRLGTVRFRSETGVGVRFLPDGKSLLLGGSDAVGMMDRETGKERNIRLTDERVLVQAVSADCRIAAGYLQEKIERKRDESMIHVWEIATGKLLRAIQSSNASDSVFSLALSPDGKRLARGGRDPLVRVIDIGTGEVLWELAAPKGDSSDGGRRSLVFSPDGKTLAGVGENESFCFWNAADGKKLREFSDYVAAGPAVFSADGKVLAAVSRPRSPKSEPARVRLWDATTGKELPCPAEQPGTACAVALSPDGKTVAISCGSNQRQIFWGLMDVGLWDAATGKKLHQFPGGWHLAFSPDGATLASVFSPPVFLHDAATGKELHREFLGHQSVVWSVAFSADGKTLTTEDRHEVKHVWDLSTGKSIRREASRPTRGNRWAYSPDGKLRAWMQGDWDTTIHIDDPASGKELRVVEADPKRFSGPCFAFSPDGKALAAVSYSPMSTLGLWDAETGKELPVVGEPPGRGCTCIAYSPDGQLLALGGHDQRVRLWDIAAGKEYCILGELHLDGTGVAAIAFSADGKTVAASMAGEVHLWETGSGKERGAIASGASSFGFSPDGLTLATAGNTAILVWDSTGATRRSAEKTPPLATLWADLAGDDAGAAYRAFGLWRSAPGGVAYLRERLRPAVVDEKQTARWIADLESNDFEVRERASRELEQLGDRAEPALRKVLTRKPAVEVQRRVEGLLERLRREVLSGEALRVWRAVEVLESIGTPESRAVLESLSRGAEGARLTKEAAVALRRLDRRVAAAR